MNKFRYSIIITFATVISVIILLLFLKPSDQQVQDASVKKTLPENEMNYGKTKWSMNPIEVMEVDDYRQPAIHNTYDKYSQSTYFMTYKALDVEVDYYYSYNGQLCLIQLEFGHIGDKYRTNSPNIIVQVNVKHESKKKMLHYFKLLIKEFSPGFGKGKTVDKSKNGKFDIEHTWESKTAIWRLYLETDKQNYHRLKLNGQHKELVKDFQL